MKPYAAPSDTSDPLGASSLTAGSVAALDRLEAHGDSEDLVSLYRPEAEVGSVAAVEVLRGPDGARRFWSQYRATFGEMRTEYRSVVADSLTAALEWTTVAVVNDVTVRYDGVTVLGSDSDLVARSFAYFDTRPLAQSISGHPSSTTEDRT